MGGSWLALGTLAGLGSGLHNGPGATAVVAHVIAGLIVYGTLGLFLGLFSARARESLIGGLCGLLVGALSGPVRGSLSATEAATLSLVIGGLIGATCWPWVRAVVALGTTILTLCRRLSQRRLSQRRGA